MERKFLVSYIILILTSLLLIILDCSAGPPLGGRIYNFFSIEARQQLNRWTGYKDLEKKNKSLLKDIAKLSYEMEIYETVKRENEQLKKTLEFESNSPLDIIPCQIVNRLPEAVNVSYFISKGAFMSIEVGDPVIGFNGVFGKVLKVGNETSIVQTLMNYNVALSAVDQRSKVRGILRWHRRFYLEGVPIYADVKEGDTIVTSGKGSVFPQGLWIGKVISISMEESGYSLRIETEPFEDFTNPDVIFVIKK